MCKSQASFRFINICKKIINRKRTIITLVSMTKITLKEWFHKILMIKKCQSQFLTVLPDQKKISMTKSAPKMLFFKTYHVT